MIDSEKPENLKCIHTETRKANEMIEAARFVVSMVALLVGSVLFLWFLRAIRWAK